MHNAASATLQKLHTFHPIDSSCKCRFMIHPLVTPVRHHISITVYKPRLKEDQDKLFLVNSRPSEYHRTRRSRHQ